MTITVELELDEADAIVEAVLKSAIETLEEEQADFAGRGNLQAHHIEDLLHNYDNLKHLKSVYNYFTTADQHYDV